MYGVDEETNWFDYDLVSAYTTGMSDIPPTRLSQCMNSPYWRSNFLRR